MDMEDMGFQEEKGKDMTDTKPENLMSAMLKERDRCKELLEAYRGIGIPGKFGASMLTYLINRADRCIASGDVIEMLQVYSEMKEFN
jgi:hypothetical protein